MRLTALQLRARFGDPAGQVREVQRLLALAAPGDVVLLPEAALTGYVSRRGDFDLSPFAEPLEGPTVAGYRRLAAAHDCLLVGPVVEAEGTARFNTTVGVTPEGELLFRYRKRHPWYPETWASPGDASAPVVAWRGVRLTVATCFDVHFLAVEAPAALDEADLLLFPSAWVDDEGDARPGHLLPLVETHRVAVLNANWGEGEPRLPGQGGSMFLAPGGTARRLGAGSGRLDVTLGPPGT